MLGTEMDENSAEKTKAHRVQLLLYAIMAIFILGPLVIFAVRTFR